MRQCNTIKTLFAAMTFVALFAAPAAAMAHEDCGYEEELAPSPPRSHHHEVAAPAATQIENFLSADYADKRRFELIFPNL